MKCVKGICAEKYRKNALYTLANQKVIEIHTTLQSMRLVMQQLMLAHF